MSILIKGIDMPKSCSDCPLAKYICFSTKQYVPLWEMARKRQGDCPLVEVPRPHGRLVDADAFYELLDGGYDLDFDEVPETKRELLRMIDDAPTIIEAEGDCWALKNGRMRNDTGKI